MSGWGRAGALLLVVAMSGTADARVLGGVELPEQLEVAGKALKLNGAAIQRKMVFNIYAVGLYTEQPIRDANAAIEADQTKRMELRLLRSASKDMIRNALRDGIKDNGGNLEALGERLDRLLNAIPDIERGAALSITYVPGRGTVLKAHNGPEVVIEGKDFADAIFAVWLGPDSGIARVRRGLVGN